MPQTRQSNALFPLGGINRSTAIQALPPYTTIDALNVSPRDVEELRDRGGSRAGMAMFAPRVSSHPVQMHAVVTLSTNDKWDFREELFADSLSHRSAMTNFTTAAVPDVDGILAHATGTAKSFVFPTPADFNASAAYLIGLTVVPYEAAHGASYVIVTNATNFATCHYVRFTIDADGDWTAAIIDRAAGVDSTIATASGSDGAAMVGELEAEVTVAGVTNVYWRGTLIVTGSLSGGSAFGIGLEPGANRAQISRARIQFYHSTDFDRQRPRTIIVQNGKLCRETWIGHLVAADVLRTLAADRPLTCAQYGNELFIADYSEVILSGRDGTLGSGTFDAPSVADFATALAAVNVKDYVLEILSSGEDTDVGAGMYSIRRALSGNLVIRGGTTATNCRWRILRSPKVCDLYELDQPPLFSGTDGVTSGNDFTSTAIGSFASYFANRDMGMYVIEFLSGGLPIAEHDIVGAGVNKLILSSVDDATGITFRCVHRNRLGEWRAARVPVEGGYPTTDADTLGSVPVGCAVVVANGGRMLLGVDSLNPNLFYASALDDPYDFAFGVGDGDAFKSSGSDVAGKIQGSITAIIPAGEDTTIIGTTTSVLRIIGEVTANGQMVAASHVVGLISQFGWCHSEKLREVYALTTQGLGVIAVDCPTCEVIQLSSKIVPKELRQINPAQTHIAMAFDVSNRLAEIALTPIASSAAVMPQPSHWIFDPATKGLFRKQYAANSHSPTTAIWYPGVSADEKCIVFGTFGGDLFKVSYQSENDCGQAISNFVFIGPIKLGRGGAEGGSLDMIAFDMASYSGALTYRVYLGRSADEAVKNALAGVYAWEGAIAAGATPDTCDRPKLSDGYAVVKLIGGPRPWAMESIPMHITSHGGLR